MLVASAGPFVKRSCERLLIISDIWTRFGAAMVEIRLSKPFAGKQSLEAVLARGESADHANFLKVCLPPEEIQRTYCTICAHIGEQGHRLITTKIRIFLYYYYYHSVGKPGVFGQRQWPPESR